MIASGAIHLDLYLTGYRTIPTIGWMFLLQVIAAFVLALAILATGSWLADLAGAGFAVATLGGYLLSLRFGLFGFVEVRTTAGIVAGLIEVAAFAALVIAAAPALPAGLKAGRRSCPRSPPLRSWRWSCSPPTWPAPRRSPSPPVRMS